MPWIPCRSEGRFPINGVAYGKVIRMAEELMAGLDVMAYGYEVTVIINGTDLGIKGGKSESLRLFGMGSPTAEGLPPEFKRLACLKEGQNEIIVRYKKLPDAKMPSLTINLSTEEQFKKGEHLFYVENLEEDSGEIRETFTLP